MSPGLSCANASGAPAAVMCVSGGTRSRTTRSAMPTPVVTSMVRARVSTARTAPCTLSCGDC